MQNPTVARSSPGAKTLSRLVFAVCFSGVALLQSASAEVRVSGTANALKLEAQNATLDETLRALQSNFKFHYQGTASSTPISGTYSGSLRSVLARLLIGHDYILHTSSGELVVSFVGKDGAAGATAANVPANGLGEGPSGAPPRRFLHGGGAAPVNTGSPDGKDCKAVINGVETAVEC
jgi:hypothetical protein